MNEYLEDIVNRIAEQITSLAAREAGQFEKAAFLERNSQQEW